MSDDTGLRTINRELVLKRIKARCKKAPEVETLEQVTKEVAWLRDQIGDSPMTDKWEKRYRAKWDLTKRYTEGVDKPSIFEIGIRAGFFARTMLAAAGSGATYLGIDNDEERCMEYARAFLVNYKAILIEGDSHALKTMDDKFDIVHIDGDHSYEGCLADLRLARTCAKRAIFVDDFINIPGVREAVSRFMIEIPNVRGYFDGGEYYNGTFVIEMEAP